MSVGETRLHAAGYGIINKNNTGMKKLRGNKKMLWNERDYIYCRDTKKYEGSVASQVMLARPSGKGKFEEWLRFGKWRREGDGKWTVWICRWGKKLSSWFVWLNLIFSKLSLHWDGWFGAKFWC